MNDDTLLTPNHNGEDGERSDNKMINSVSHDSIYSLGTHRRAGSDIPMTGEIPLDFDADISVSPEKKSRRKSLLKKSVSQEVLTSEDGTQSQLRAKKGRLSKSVSFHDQVELVEINDSEIDDTPTIAMQASPPKKQNSTKRFVSLSQDFGSYDFDKIVDSHPRDVEGRANADPAKISAVFNFAWLITIVCVVLVVIIATVIIVISLVVLGNKCAAPLSSKQLNVEKHSFPYFLTSDQSNLIDHLIVQTTGDVRFYFDRNLNGSSAATVNIVATHFSVTQKKQGYKSSNVVYTRENKTLNIVITERYDLLSGLEGIWGGHLCSGTNVEVRLPSILRGRLRSLTVRSTMKGSVFVNLEKVKTEDHRTSFDVVTLNAVAGDIHVSNMRINQKLSIIALSSAINVTNVVASGNMTVQSESEPIRIMNLEIADSLFVNAINKFDSIYVSTITNTSGLTLNAASSFSGTVMVDFDARVLCTETTFETKNSPYSNKKVIVNTPPSDYVILGQDQDHVKAGFVQSRNCENQQLKPNKISAFAYNDMIMNILI